MGGLPEKLDELTFGGGLSEHEDSWLQSQGFSRLENCIQDKAGAVVKLPGFAAYADDDFVNDTGEALAANEITDFGGHPKLVRRAGHLAIVSNGYLFAKASVDAEGWSLRGRCSPWVCERNPMIDCDPGWELTEVPSRATTVYHDACRTGDWIVTAYIYTPPGGGYDDVRLAVTFTHEVTGVTVFQHVQAFATGLEGPIRIVPWDTAGAALVVFGRSTPNLRYVRVDTSGFGTEGTLVSGSSYYWTPDADSHDGVPYHWVFDVWSDGAGVGWVATRDDAANGDIDIRRFTMSGTVLTETHAQVVATTGGPIAIALSKSTTSRLTVAYAQQVRTGYVSESTCQVRAFARSLTLGSSVYADTLLFENEAYGGIASGGAQWQVATIGVVQAQTSGGTDGDFVVWFDPNGTDNGVDIRRGGEFAVDAPVTRGRWITAVTASLDASMVFCAQQRIVGKPFFDGTRVAWLSQYAFGQCPSTLTTVVNHHYAVVGCEPRAGSAGVAYRARPLGQFALEGAIAAPSSEFASPDDPLWSTLSASFQDSRGAWHFTGIEADPGTLRLRIVDYRLVADDRVGCFAELGGATYIVGALLSTWDGLRCIEAGWLTEPVIEDTSTVAGALDAGTRYYVCRWARTNTAGELIRSRPSVAKAVTNTSDRHNHLRVAPLALSALMLADTMSVFLEVYRTKSTGTRPFYLYSRIEVDPQSYEPLEFDDNLPDSGLAGAYNQVLEAEGAPGQELKNDPPISPQSITFWKNRIVITDGEQIAYSKEGLPSRQAEFSLLQVIPRASRQRLTAVAALGEILACFTADSAGYVVGDGPAANGQGSTLTGPTMLNDTIGCIWPSGILAIAAGLIVPSRGGLQLLSPKLSWSYIGAAIERTASEYPRVRDADVELGADRAWFALSTSDRVRGVFAVLDTLHNTWSLAHEDFDPSTVRAVGDELVWSNAAGETYVGPDGWTVGSSAYGMLAETPWMKPGGVLAEIRIRKLWLLFEQLGLSTLRVEIGYDFEDTYSHAVEFSFSELNAMEGDPAKMARLAAPRQRCHAFRLRITETEPGGEGFRFVALRMLTALRGAKGPLKGTDNAGGGFRAP